MAEKSKKINKVKKENKKIVPLKKETTKVEKVVKKTANVGAASKSFWKNNKSTIIIVGFIVLLLAVTFLIEGNEKKSTEVDYSSVGTEIKAWYDDTQKDQNVVTVIALSYCGYCANYKPIITALSSERGFKLYWFEIDTMSEEDSAALQNTYKLEQYSGSSPYTVVTKKGAFVKDVVGYMEKAELVSFLEGAGAL